MVDKFDALLAYRQDSAFPHYASSGSAGYYGGVSIFTRPLIEIPEFNKTNPALVINQNPAPRSTAVTTTASTDYSTFDGKTFLIFGIIVAAIWFLGR
jgi:hypothetical protein